MSIIGWMIAVVLFGTMRWIVKDYEKDLESAYHELSALREENAALRAGNFTIRQQLAALGEQARMCEAATMDFMEQVRIIEASMGKTAVRPRTAEEREQVVDDATRADLAAELNAPL